MNFTRPQPESRSRHLNLFCALLLWAVLPAAAANAQDRALIVAIDSYADTRLADLPANLAANDAAAIEKVLTEKLGYKHEDIKILRNEEATREAILAAFGQWLSPGDANGGGHRSYFYYSGLGYFEPDRGGEEEDRMDETLVPFDAALNADARPSQISGMISDDEIEELLREFSHREVTLVLDTSHSGLVTRSRNLAARSMSRMRVPNVDGAVRRITQEGPLAAHKREGPFIDGVDIPRGSLTVWSAASPTQAALVAGEDDKPKGLFTLLYEEGIAAGIADTNTNGIVSNAELLGHIVRNSAAYCTAFRERCEMGLRPRLDPLRAYAETAWADREKVPERKERRLSLARLQDFVNGLGSSMVEITQSPMSPVHVGAKDIRFSVRSLTSGYVVLLNLTDDGMLFQLYPNQYSGIGASGEPQRVQANAPLVVPDESYPMTFSATVPARGHIVAIVTPDPVAFDAPVTSRPIASVTPGEAIGVYLAHLSASLHKPLNTGSVAADTDTARWSVRVLPYEILP